jgi:pyruvate dehydrogenase E1 component alpha subunit
MATQRLADFGSGDLLASFRAMLLIRRFEERAGQMFAMGLIGGFCHLCVGQEAVAVGLRQAARIGDQFIASYRMHGHLLASGADPRAVIAELVGRRYGISRGKGGSMHMFAPDRDFFGGQGITGAQAPIGTGLAFANAYRGDNKVCVALLGDGASDQGQLTESFVMAERWSLPIVFVIENNLPQFERPALANRGASFNIPGEAVDGMCLTSVREAATRALGWARAGNGPTLLEMRIERFRGHAAAEQRRKHGERDPIERLRAAILAAGLAEEADLRRVDAEIRARVAEIADQAVSCDEPEESELMTDILL